MAKSPTDGKPKRGLASLTCERWREIASMGGNAVPNEKRSFSTDNSLAANAGRKGGQSIDGAKRTFSTDRKLAVEAGAKGGRAGRKSPDQKGTPES